MVIQLGLKYAATKMSIQSLAPVPVKTTRETPSALVDSSYLELPLEKKTPPSPPIPLPNHHKKGARIEKANVGTA